MTLDPVHFDGIAGLADRIDYDAEDQDHRDSAETVWEHYLDPLYGESDDPILEPLGELARLTGNAAVLTQHGLTDSMLDLVFDTIEAVVVAVWGTAHLAGVSGYIADQLEARSAD
jgi:hypothetical protein